MSIVSGDQAVTALLSGSTITGQVGAPAFITYSFPLTAPKYLLDAEGTRGAETFGAATAAFQSLVRAAFSQYETAANIVFFEVTPDQGEIQITTFDFQKWSNVPNAAAFAYSPVNAFVDRSIPGIPSDIVFDYKYADKANFVNILHEVGHALGFKHVDEGDVRLAPELSTVNYTIMFSGAIGTTDHLGTLDIAAAQKLYGVHDQGVVQGDDGNNAINGGASADFIKANAGHDMVNGGSGDDILLGGNGNDHLFGMSANGGTDGNDTILAGDGSDYIQGNAGKDFLAGEDGSDRINGGADDDIAYGGGGNDTINGNKGNDLIYGQGDNDSLRGGQGNDSIDGDAGNDAVGGDLGSDTLSGGAGLDTFYFADQGSLIGAPDVVRDFVHGDDHFSLGFAVSAVLTGASQASLSAAQTFAQQLFTGRAGDHEVAVLAVGSDTYLFYAGNGSNTIDSAINLAGINPSIITVVDFV